MTASRWAELKRELVAAAPAMGIDKIGFTTADAFSSLKQVLERHRALGRESGFEHEDLDERTSPQRLLPEAQSIIAIAVAYPSKLSNPPQSVPGAYRGILSRSAWGEDYHVALRRRLERLAAWLRERVPDVRLESMVDTGALVDRAVAERAGIGFVGHNCSVITDEFGSWVYLGEMLTNIPFEPDEPVLDSCGDCRICIEACPTDALVGFGELDAQRCVSYLTQTKGVLPDAFKKKIGNRLYGCDTCQIVCPKNRGKHFTHHAELEPDPDIVKPLLLPLLELSNKEFKRIYGTSAAAWRGKTPIQRNAIIALGHFKDETARSKLEQLLREDSREAIQDAAKWALDRLNLSKE
jgi:epoxyqueuosine reductase